MTKRWKHRPEGSNWGEFGPDDQIGRLNYLTPQKVLEGIAEVKEGKTFCLSMPLDLPGGNGLNPARHPPRRARDRSLSRRADRVLFAGHAGRSAGPGTGGGSAGHITAAGGTEVRRPQGEHGPNGVVELADAAEAGCKRDVRERHVGRFDQQPCGVRSMGTGDRERPGSEFVGHHPIEMPFAVSEPPCEAGHTITFDRAVGDQSHRPTDRILAQIPLRTAGCGIRSAALARAVSPLLSSRRGVVELDVRPFRRDRWAARPAVDARRAHRGHEPAVETPVTALHDAVTLVGIKRQHHPIMPRPTERNQRVSDRTIRVRFPLGLGRNRQRFESVVRRSDDRAQHPEPGETEHDTAEKADLLADELSESADEEAAAR